MSTALPSACQALLNAAKFAKRDHAARQLEHDELVEKMVAEVRKTNPTLADHYIAIAEQLAADAEVLAETGQLFMTFEQE